MTLLHIIPPFSLPDGPGLGVSLLLVACGAVVLAVWKWRRGRG